MDTLTPESALDWTTDPDVVEARKHLADVTAIHEERERDRTNCWEWRTSEDLFLRARHRGEWAQTDAAAASAHAYVVQASQRMALAERAAKARVQPVWDLKFREAWADVESVVTGSLLQAMIAWHGLAEEAAAKGVTVPVLLPENLHPDAMAVWTSWVRGQLHLDDR
jgi:hypothetical protein